MIQCHQDLPFKFDIAEIVLFFKYCFVQDLHRIVVTLTASFLLFDEKNLRKTSLTKQTNDLNGSKVYFVTE